MISLYRAVRDFAVRAEVGGVSLDLLEISERLRDFAQLRYRLTFDGEKLKIAEDTEEPRPPRNRSSRARGFTNASS